jgi:hypothetical protein
VTSHEAKQILLLYRPAVDREDSEFSEALALTKSDPELNAWFQQHCAFQNAANSAFSNIPVPVGLKEQILSERRAHLTLSSRRKILATASVMVILACAGIFAFRNLQPGPVRDNSFASYHSNMIGKIIRYPTMDLETNDLQAIKQNLAKRGQSNLVFTASLDKTAGTGCALLEWHDKPVSMICFNSGKNGNPKKPDLFLFIADKATIKDPPAASVPIVARVRKGIVSGSWTSGDKIYVLAALGDEDFVKQYFPPNGPG